MANALTQKAQKDSVDVGIVTKIGPTKPERSYLQQTDVPAFSLSEALRIARAIVDNYGGHPASPLDVASALNVQPGSSQFRMLCGSSIAYGLTEGGCNAKEIVVTPLATRILQPLEDNDDLFAKREALLKPRIINEFLTKYSKSPLPRQEIGQNVLKSMGVPAARVETVWEFILGAAADVGYIRTIKEKQYIDLAAGATPKVQADEIDDADEGDENSGTQASEMSTVPIGAQAQQRDVEGARRVFITHGKNTTFIDPIKKLLGFGEMIPVVSAEKQTVSQPVPDKVLDDMRSCQSAIIHVDSDRVLLDPEGKEHTVINPNVLIEIGAAMALYGRRFILLVRNGIQLPSNLQGLFEVRYEGDSLDGAATIRLLEAINDMKKTPLPD